MIGLIACGKSKRNIPCAARDLYTGSLFKLARRYVEARCPTWFILSAKHGLLRTDSIIEPYELALGGMSKAARREWAMRVGGQLREFPGETFLVIAGARYLEALDGLPYLCPTQGLSIGRMMSKLKRESSS